MSTVFERIIDTRAEGIAREVLGDVPDDKLAGFALGYKSAYKLAVKEFEEILLMEYDSNTDGVQETVRLFKKRMLLFHTEYPTKDIEL